MFAKLMLGTLYTTLIGGAVLFHEGAIVVDVKEKNAGGDHVFVLAPATLVSWGARMIPDSKMPRLPREARELMPAIAIAAQEMQGLPDMVFVEVDDGNDHVKVQKRGDKIVIDVDTRDEIVHVSVPIRTIESALRALASRDTV